MHLSSPDFIIWFWLKHKSHKKFEIIVFTECSPWVRQCYRKKSFLLPLVGGSQMLDLVC